MCFCADVALCGPVPTAIKLPSSSLIRYLPPSSKMSSTSSSKATIASLKAEIDELRQSIQNLNTELSGLKMSLLNEATTTTTPVKAPKEKKVRDPDAPKKPVKGFMLFSQQKRAEIKAANPDMTFGQIGAELGRLWKALSAEEQATYKA